MHRKFVGLSCLVILLWRLLCCCKVVHNDRTWHLSTCALGTYAPTLPSTSPMGNKLKARLIKALVWPIVTYGSEAWTLNKELCENVEAFEMQCYRRAMRISYVEHVTNEEVLRRVGRPRQGPVGASEITQTEILRSYNATWESRERYYAGIMAGKRQQGGQKKQWIDDIVQWGNRSLVEMVRQAENRKSYQCLVHEAAYARTSGMASWWWAVWGGWFASQQS